MIKHKCIVKLQYGSYSGNEIVFCDENDESEQAKCDFLPMAYKQGKIISRDNFEVVR